MIVSRVLNQYNKRHASYVTGHPFGSSRLTFEALTEKLKSLAKIL